MRTIRSAAPATLRVPDSAIWALRDFHVRAVRHGVQFPSRRRFSV